MLQKSVMSARSALVQEWVLAWSGLGCIGDFSTGGPLRLAGGGSGTLTGEHLGILDLHLGTTQWASGSTRLAMRSPVICKSRFRATSRSPEAIPTHCVHRFDPATFYWSRETIGSPG